jgi:signal transduction histidine kinase/ligand-binding sensor domain-containing protein
MLLCMASALARPLAQYQQRTFGASDGAPEEINAMGQDRDGMMWFGGANGLYTFDGQRFARSDVEYSAGPRTVYFMRGDPAGGIWIGWMRGGVTLVRNGTARHFDAADGIPSGTVWGFDFDQSGHVWAAGLNGVARFDGKTWKRMGPQDGFDADHAAAVSVDPGGDVGVFTEKGLYIWRKGAQRFDPPIGKTQTRQPLAIGPQGQMYFIAKTGIRRIASLQRFDQPDFPMLYRETGEQSGSFLADRAGGLWFDSYHGLHRLARPEADASLAGQLRADTETIPFSTGSMGTVVYCMFEDDRGNVWIATDRGVVRFRPSDLLPVSLQSGDALIQSSILAAGSDGSMWIRTVYPNVTWLRFDAAGKVLARYRGDFSDAAVQDGDGLLTVSAQRQVVWLRDGRTTPFGPPLPKGRITALARDASGRVWVAMSERQLLRGDGTAWLPVAGLPQGQVTMLHADADGAVWLGYGDSHLVKVTGAGTTAWGAAQGLSVGAISSIARTGGTLWVAGARGLAVLQAGRFRALASAPEMLDDLAGLLADRRGGLWLTGRAGLMYLSPAQLRQCLAACTAAVVPALFDNADGLKGRSAGGLNAQLAQDAQGRVWTVTGIGAYRIEVAMDAAREIAPRALIMSATVAGTRHNGSAPLVVPAGTHDVQFDYTAPAPGTPERVRFRYRLAGYDKTWQEAGGRRQAFYTGLAPGHYQFEVVAAQGNSDWSPSATRAIAITPAWYQTWWWRAACVLAVLAALALSYRLRVRRITQRVREQSETRQQERERIARELHDTVLQTNFALLLQVRAVAATAAGDPLGQRLDTIVSQAQATLSEGRDKVAGLRAEQHEQGPAFIAVLERHARVVLEGSDLALACSSRGRPWAFGETVARECLAIVGEAVSNARKHAQAEVVRIEVRYGLLSCDVVVSDDGCGIAPVHRAGRIGHWGLAGMRERAALIKARFEVDSGEEGTRIRLRIWRWRAGGE